MKFFIFILMTLSISQVAFAADLNCSHEAVRRAINKTAQKHKVSSEGLGFRYVGADFVNDWPSKGHWFEASHEYIEVYYADDIDRYKIPKAKPLARYKVAVRTIYSYDSQWKEVDYRPRFCSIKEIEEIGKDQWPRIYNRFSQFM